jgi:hypothetical protein
MKWFEKELIRSFVHTSGECNRLSAALDEPDYKDKIGEDQFEMAKIHLGHLENLRDVIGQRITAAGLKDRVGEFYDDTFCPVNDYFYLDREKVFQWAFHGCMREIYRRAQPSANWDDILAKLKTGEIDDSPSDKLIDRHYISKVELDYVVAKWKKAFAFVRHFKDNCNTVIDYFGEGKVKDKVIPERIDENGFKHPSYRGYEDLPSGQEMIKQILISKGVLEVEDTSKAILDAVIDRIKTCRDFYRFDREEEEFDYAIYLGPSPTICADTVVKYWKSRGVDLTIEDHGDENTLWEHDYYADDVEEEDDLPVIDDDDVQENQESHEDHQAAEGSQVP